MKQGLLSFETLQSFDGLHNELHTYTYADLFFKMVSEGEEIESCCLLILNTSMQCVKRISGE